MCDMACNGDCGCTAPLTLRFKKLCSEAKAPTYGSDGAACFDFYSVDEGVLHNSHRSMVFGTGIAIQIPQGYALNVYSRSGHGFNSSVRLANSTGIIDEDYTGEIKVKLVLDDPAMLFKVHKGDRIAQGRLEKVQRTEFVEVDELINTKRGENGFGSTG